MNSNLGTFLPTWNYSACFRWGWYFTFWALHWWIVFGVLVNNCCVSLVRFLHFYENQILLCHSRSTTVYPRTGLAYGLQIQIKFAWDTFRWILSSLTFMQWTWFSNLEFLLIFWIRYTFIFKYALSLNLEIRIKISVSHIQKKTTPHNSGRIYTNMLHEWGWAEMSVWWQWFWLKIARFCIGTHSHKREPTLALWNAIETPRITVIRKRKDTLV